MRMNHEERTAIQNSYCSKLVDYLPTLRSVAKITQNQLAKKLGVTRSTIVVVESRKRPLQWYMYLAMVLVFMQNEDAKKMINSFELFDGDVLTKIF